MAAFKGESSYRGYTIFREGAEFIAETADSEEDLFEMKASNVFSLVQAIDELWLALDGITSSSDGVNLPVWYENWLDAGGSGRLTVPHIASIPPVDGRFSRSALAAFLITQTSVLAEGADDGDIDAEAFSRFLEDAVYLFPPSSFVAHFHYKGRVFTARTQAESGGGPHLRILNLCVDGMEMI